MVRQLTNKTAPRNDAHTSRAERGDRVASWEDTIKENKIGGDRMPKDRQKGSASDGYLAGRETEHDTSLVIVWWNTIVTATV